VANQQIDAIDRVIKNAIEVMESSKYQIFEICETAIEERNIIAKELQEIMELTTDTIDQVDSIERKYRHARVRLSEVSREFNRYSEMDIKQAYENATVLQLDLTIFQEKETHLKARRSELQKRLKSVEKQVARAETIVSQMNVALEYLSGDLSQVTRILESAKNRQLFGLKIILAQEDERKRIAREIHDGMAQTMANVVLRSEIAERMLLKQELIAVKDELSALRSQVRGGLEEVRKIIFNLRPMALDDLGLVPTVRKYAQDFEDRTRILTEFELQGKEARLPSGMEVALFRLVQEAFSNVSKHANATFVSLILSFDANGVSISFKDNGVGFQVESIEQRMATNNHFGLMGMRERVELLEGRLDFESELGVGTKISIYIPIGVDQKEDSDNGAIN
jgi:two-component system, NarL family, sensor histidine kinase DegS